MVWSGMIPGIVPLSGSAMHAITSLYPVPGTWGVWVVHVVHNALVRYIPLYIMLYVVGILDIL